MKNHEEDGSAKEPKQFQFIQDITESPDNLSKKRTSSQITPIEVNHSPSSLVNSDGKSTLSTHTDELKICSVNMSKQLKISGQVENSVSQLNLEHFKF